MGVISKKPKGSNPASAMAWLAIRFGGEPIRVNVPPKLEARARGSSRPASERSVLTATPITAGINTAVVATLFIKAESSAAPPIRMTTSSHSRSPARRNIARPIMVATPV